MLLGDTIAAISSAAGPASRMIVRTSGPASFPAAARLAGAAFSPEPNSARFFRLAWRGLSVPAWLYTFLAPRSYTGEDMVEYHLPGNPLLCRMLLDELLREGGGGGAGELPIRAAEPGEFTARAHFNGKLPLEACEGVAAAIHASNERELAAARRLLAGELAGRLSPIGELLAQTLALVEAQIDFSDEGISFLQQSELRDRLASVEAGLRQLLADSSRLARLAHEPRVLLVGRPNAGKSTLLNVLCGAERAVVSPEAGTTRDVIWAPAVLRRGLIHLADAAGLEDGEPGRLSEGEPGRPRPGQSSDTDKDSGPRTARLSPSEDAASHIARQMQSHAARAAQRADVLVLVREVTDEHEPIPLPRSADIVVRSKIDLLPTGAAVSEGVAVSARTGQGIVELRDALDRHCFGPTAAAESLALTGRHVAAIEDALAAIGRAESQLTAAPELLALELREAQIAIGQVLGQITPDDLLGRIFSTFCIGK